MLKYFIGLIIIVVLAVGGYYLVYGTKSSGPAQPSQPQVQQIATSTYATSSFSVVYPVDFTVDPNFQNTEVSPTKPIAGVKFTIPMTMATGTNLSSDSYLSIEQLPRAKNCTADIYLSQNVKATPWTDNGVAYSVATSTDAGAGNLYEEQVYAISGSSPCTAVRYFIHSGNIGNYPEGAVTAFDESALLAAFDKIRQSLSLTPSAQ